MFQAKAINVSVDFAAHRRIVSKLSLSTFSVPAVLSINVPMHVFYYDVDINYSFFVLLFYQLFHNFFYGLQFSLAALAVRERFKLLNTYVLRFVSIESIQ